jgi:curved DNA-binding protein
MTVNLRRELRRISRKRYLITWQDDDGITHSVEVQGVNHSHSGIAVQSPVELPCDCSVYIQEQGESPLGYSRVRHCTAREDSYLVGLELKQREKGAESDVVTDRDINLYEFLQISPNAQAATIQRVYRYLAARYHPDNPDTGDPEKFLLLNQAYAVLSDPKRRAEYDAELRHRENGPSPVFDTVDFLDGIDGELNRRLGVLSVLYRRCRANVSDSKISLIELEKIMGFPREYLDFTTWYLKSKKYIVREDNSDFSLTSLGVDFVESNLSSLPLLRKLLQAGISPIQNSQAGHSNGSTPRNPTYLPSPFEQAEDEDEVA